MKYFLCFLFAISTHFLLAQAGHRIQIELDNYEHDTIIVGYYYGEQTLILDSLVRTGDKQFIVEGEDTLKQGIYLFLTQPDNSFTQFIINEDQHFSLSTDVLEPGKVSFEGSDENDLFYDYLTFLTEQRKKIEQLNVDKEEAKKVGQDTLQFEEKKAKYDDMVRARQLEIIEKHPSTIMRLLMDANIPLEVPEYAGTDEEIQRQKYYWYRKHYFDRIHLGHQATLRTPFIHQRVQYYIKNLTPMDPDSISQTLDGLFTQMEPAEDLYRYYLSHFLNKYAKSKIVGYDAIYVHLVDNYYAEGKAPWVSEENMKKITRNARGIKPTLAGKTAKDFTVYTEDGTPITLSKMDADYKVLFFWSPDCGHCAKAIPDIVEFNDKWKDKGVELITICNRSGDKYQECWKAVQDKGMEELVNTGDEKRVATLLSKYYVTTTPKIYIIDRDQKIVLKGIGAQQLDEVLTKITETEAAQKDGRK